MRRMQRMNKKHASRRGETAPGQIRSTTKPGLHVKAGTTSDGLAPVQAGEILRDFVEVKNAALRRFAEELEDSEVDERIRQ